MGRMQGTHDASVAHRKPYKPKDNARKSSATAVAPVKKQLRDLRRSLRRPDNLPANIRQERERALAALEHEIRSLEGSKREHKEKNKVIGRYHRIRFFERQKATRRLKQATRAANATVDPESKTKLQSTVHNCEVDLNYTIYFPLLEPYSSLYSELKTVGTEDGEDGINRQHPMWKRVEEAMAENTLEKLRNRKHEAKQPSKSLSGGNTTSRPSKGASRATEAPKSRDQDSDDQDESMSFFEKPDD